jgi:predicted PurR-regulated permease PerM
MASELHAQRSLVFLVLLAVALIAVIISPFWVPLTLAAVFASALQGWMNGLSTLLRGRRKLAALALTAGVLLAVLLPLGGLGAALTKEILYGIQWVRAALASEGIDGLLHRLPGSIEQLVQRLVAAIPDPQNLLRSVAAAGGGGTAQALGGFLVGAGTAVFRAALFLIALFFFLTDGERLVFWLDGHVPLGPGQLRTLLGEFRRTSVSVLVASLATAVIQTATSVVGYLIARAPNPLFLALATFVVALIPAVGGSVMVVAVGLLLLATGHAVSGAFLVVWGAVVVSLVDSVVRPYLLRGGLAVHGGLLFFALLGGLAVFGGIGLLIGPLALTFLVTALNMYSREFGPPGAYTPAAPAPAAVPPEPAARAPAPAPEPDAGKPPAA